MLLIWPPNLCVHLWISALEHSSTLGSVGFWSLQDWWLNSHRLFLLFWIPIPREAWWAPQLAVHGLDDRGDIRICHGLGYNPTLWWVQSLIPEFMRLWLATSALPKLADRPHLDLHIKQESSILGNTVVFFLAENYLRKSIPLFGSELCTVKKYVLFSEL